MKCRVCGVLRARRRAPLLAYSSLTLRYACAYQRGFFVRTSTNEETPRSIAKTIAWYFRRFNMQYIELSSKVGGSTCVTYWDQSTIRICLKKTSVQHTKTVQTIRTPG